MSWHTTAPPPPQEGGLIRDAELAHLTLILSASLSSNNKLTNFVLHFLWLETTFKVPDSIYRIFTFRLLTLPDLSIFFVGYFYERHRKRELT